MANYRELYSQLRRGGYDSVLSKLYSDIPYARGRAVRLMESFEAVFDVESMERVALFSAPGRTELGGNHTDHQHGHVLCAAVNLDVLACASPNGRNIVCIHSEGYPPLEIELNNLDPEKEEQGTSAALVRGVAAGFVQRGFVPDGFDAYITSDVLAGSGLSSSAAYEVLIGNIFNHFFCDGKVDAIEIAKIGQFAENVYFGKPCGLMDQVASSIGGIVSIDFEDSSAPVVKGVCCDFRSTDHVLCIVDTGSCHADLTEDYAQIPREMGSVASWFGKDYLRQVPRVQFEGSLSALRGACGDRAVLRAMHYYDDDRRAVLQADALLQCDFDQFLDLVNESGISSAALLQNIYTCSEPKQQAVSVALAVGRRILNGTGAIRVHGGGFAGTIQAFVPTNKRNEFCTGMEAVLGHGACFVLDIRSVGGCVIAG